MAKDTTDDGLRGPSIDQQADNHATVNLDDKDEKFEDDAIDETYDLYVPLPPLKGVPPETSPLTVRAVITGIILGSLVNASNVYLGLKTGFTFSATMFGAIFGYAIIVLVSKTSFPIIGGGGFGPQENSIVQAAATGAGGMSGVFVAGLPAMYQLGLLSDDPKKDFGRLLTITIVCAFFGLFAAVPLRKFFIINVARDLNLMFPSPTATALAIRSMHAVGTGAQDAISKIKTMGYSFLGACIHTITAQYATGILRDWHIFTWFYIWGGYNNFAQDIDNWGWYILLTPAFFGSGILVGLNVAISWFFGTIVAWGIIGPTLVHYGECIGLQPAPDSEKWSAIVSFNSMTIAPEDPDWVPSPRYWMLWPGVMVLVAYSMAEFVIHFRVLWDGAKFAFRSGAKSLNNRLQAQGKSSAFLAKHAARADDESNLVEDFAPPSQQVPGWIWGSGTVVMVVVSCLVCHFQFKMNAGLAILACILGIIFAFLSIHGGAVTDVTPLTASAKASQLVFGGVTANQGYDVKDAQRINLIAGSIASGAANVASDLTSDFRVGFLLRTPPHLQFYAQAIGCVVSVFLAPGIFVLFMAAYPCIWQGVSLTETCPFNAPSVYAWRAVAEAVTNPNIPIPLSSGIFSGVVGFIAVAQAFFKNFYLTGEREKYRIWLPNWMSIGVAWVLGADSGYSNAVLFGSITAWWWKKYFPKNFETHGFAAAAGLIAGEGFAGVINAAIVLGGGGGDAVGSSIALPGGDW